MAPQSPCLPYPLSLLLPSFLACLTFTSGPCVSCALVCASGFPGFSGHFHSAQLKSTSRKERHHVVPSYDILKYRTCFTAPLFPHYCWPKQHNQKSGPTPLRVSYRHSNGEYSSASVYRLMSVLRNSVPLVAPQYALQRWVTRSRYWRSHDSLILHDSLYIAAPPISSVTLSS